MKKFYLLLVISATHLIGVAQSQTTQWRAISDDLFVTYYQHSDSSLSRGLHRQVSEGINSIQTFFGIRLAKRFDVYIYPHRSQLDAQWSSAWGVPGFKSECWMVASGVADRFDILSPNVWATEACEHDAGNPSAYQQLITHELTHVFHGQQNPVPDFTGLDDLAWLIEGVATFASGQLTEQRLASVKKLVQQNQQPTALSNFWSGKDRYGLAGSLVAFVDQKVERKMLLEFLKETKTEAILSKMGMTEAELLSAWKKWVLEQ